MASRESFSEEEDEKKENVHVAVATKEVDTAAELVAGDDIELDPAEADRIRKKIDWHILPLMCGEYIPYSVVPVQAWVKILFVP